MTTSARRSSSLNGSLPGSKVQDAGASRSPGEAKLGQGEREMYLRWLLDVTQLPTASGREWRVIEWIRSWVAARADLKLVEDAAGNLVVSPKKAWGMGGKKKSRPVFITAHLDHPAFVVERVIGPGTVEMSFRGGVMDDYFVDAIVRVHLGEGGGDARDGQSVLVRLAGEGGGVSDPVGGERLFKTYLADVEGDDDVDIRIGDVGVWELAKAEVDGAGVVHTLGCDDLAAVAAALGAMESLRLAVKSGEKVEDVRLLFTRSEEIGFTGAIAACKHKTMPKDARVIALENSRSFSDSPVGGGPIVRVGDRMSIFDPRLTAACAKRAETLAGKPATPVATQKVSEVPAGWKWQRKLMAGGACEASVFCTYGYTATCLCLPLGNYHNMADLTAVQEGSFDRSGGRKPRVGREFIHSEDYFGLIDLLVAIGRELPEADPVLGRIEKLFVKTGWVLGEKKKTVVKGGKKKAGKKAVSKGKPTVKAGKAAARGRNQK